MADQPAWGIAQTWPLRPHPRAARCRGQGDPSDAPSFSRAPVGNHDDPAPATECER